MSAHPSRLVLLGHPVHHSRSPAVQNAALEHAGVALTYEALDVEPSDLARQLAALVATRAAGNVTVPHKRAVATCCDECRPLAARTGAVNTFWVNEAGALVGDNTDVDGFAHLARRVLGRVPRADRVAVLGAGGAAAAVLAAVERWERCSVVLWNRTRARSDALAARFPVVAGVADAPDAAVDGCSVVVNATTIGLTDEAMPVAVTSLPPGAAVVDLVYRPGETPWVRAARAAGHPAADGLAMLVEQGALAFERWLGIPAPREVMWRAAREIV